MIGQAELAFVGPAPAVAASTERRIDITLDRLRDSFDALSDEQRITLVNKEWWSAVDFICALRAMERGEEEALGRPRPGTVADIYDRIVSPGEHILEALIRVRNAFFQQS